MQPECSSLSGSGTKWHNALWVWHNPCHYLSFSLHAPVNPFNLVTETFLATLQIFFNREQMWLLNRCCPDDHKWCTNVHLPQMRDANFHLVLSCRLCLSFRSNPSYLDPIYNGDELLIAETQSSLRRPITTGLIASAAENKHTGKHALMCVPSEPCLLNHRTKLKQTGALKENIHASEHVDVSF